MKELRIKYYVCDAGSLMQIARFLLASESAATLIPIFSSSSTDYVPYQLIHTFSQLSHFQISMESQAEMSRCQSKVIFFRKIIGSSQPLHTSYSLFFVITQNGTQERHA